ncbi:MAG: hypothetical protein Q9222_000279 [Ikaeria aurantiellina]
MFSYLRSNNRRSALPSPSVPSNASARHVHTLQRSNEDLFFHHASYTSEQPASSPISPDPPILPPIPRVASQHESSDEHYYESRRSQKGSLVAGENTEEKEKMSALQPIMSEDPSVHGRRLDDQRPLSSRSDGTGAAPVPLLPKPQYKNRQLQPPHPQSDFMRSHSEPFSKHTEARTQEQAEEGAQPARAPPPPPLKLSRGSVPSNAPNRQSKAKFNLLNPMALLARRRSHQAVAEANSEKSQYKGAYPPVLGIPDDFDPRIRGKVVHDFSAPRSGKNRPSDRARGANKQREAIIYNSRKTSPNPSISCVDDDSPSSGEREHTPQFTEHFDDEFGPLKDGQAKQKASAFMYQVSLSEPQAEPQSSTLPPFARHLPSDITTTANVIQKTSSPPPKKSLEIVPESSVPDPIATNKSLPSTPPSSPPVKARSRASSNGDQSYQPAGLPKHFKSNASRFSFDLTGVGSAAQEKLLEEKHRQNERNKARRSDDLNSTGSGTFAKDVDDDNGEDYSDDYGDMDDVDGLEERIPGINADVEDTVAVEAQHDPHGSNFASPGKSSFHSDPSLASTGITSPNTPRDSIGQSVDATITKTPSYLVSSHDGPQINLHPGTITRPPGEDLRGTTHAHPAIYTRSSMTCLARPVGGNDDDDLYFDDGMIEDLDEQDNHAFDESVFDDDSSRVYGLALRDQHDLLRNAEGSIVQHHPSVLNVKTNPAPESIDRGAGQLNEVDAESRDSVTQLNRELRTSFSRVADLPSYTAYHDALALGINQAALNGKFLRRSSFNQSAENPSCDTIGLSPALDNAAVSQPKGLPIDNEVGNADDFECEDGLADDSIIAAANAEALENDDEGFYGQEFGFFARASSSSGEAEYANGGYFGARGFEGIGRSHSGRANEPSLTPITERSEWSNRNSAISLAMHGYQPHSAGAQPSAGLAQLADMMHLEDDDMSLSALMKLRRGAWGGSNASLHSSSSGSPLTYVPAVGFPAAVPMQHSNSSNGNVHVSNSSPLTMQSDHNFTSSTYSLASSNGFASSSNEDSQPSPASATITFSTQQQALPIQQQQHPPPQSAPAFLPQQQQFLQQALPVLSPPTVNVLPKQPQRRSISPVKRGSMGPPPKPTTKGHSRNSSNTSESVSYVLETAGEDGGQGRWVLEKRRVDESGAVEVLGREVVEGGRI